MSSTPSRQSRGELLSPAGGLSSGVYALQSGADALYLGLSAFSARKAARNFTLDEFARVKALAEKDGKRVYAAVNTVVRDDELGRAAEMLWNLQALEVDGVIVQDLGICGMLRKHFPRLPVHASTQMGIHNSAGVGFLKTLGIRRVILSRELSFDEIGRIRKDHPDMEIEVFIHGALCYSFSGLCLASGLMLGRSGNRGECAQVCRGWFAAGAGKGYFFSCNDLAAGEDVLRLRDMGVDAFKIEGRMKPPAWIAAVTAYYRAILDGKPGEAAEAAFRKARTLFSRRPTRGHLPGNGGTDLLNPDYPGHLGLPAGTAAAARGGSRPGFLLRLQTDLAVRDGLLFFPSPGDGGRGNTDSPPREPVRFAVESLEVRGARTVSARAGEEVFIPCAAAPPPGTEVYKTSSHDAKTPETGGDLPAKRVSVDVGLRILPGALVLSARPSEPFFPGVEESFPAAPEPARIPRPFAEIAENRLSAPGDSRFAVRRFEVKNESMLPEDGIFLSPAVLNGIRRAFYSRLEESFTAAGERTAAAAASEPDAAGSGTAAAESGGAVPAETAGRRDEPGLPPPQTLPPPDRHPPPRRDLIRGDRAGIPFVTDFSRLSPDDLFADEAGRLCLPLAPVLFDPEPYLAAAEAFVRRVLRERPGARFAVGLGNPGHFGLVPAFAGDAAVGFFIDYGIYVANRRTRDLLEGLVPRLAFVYPWIEDPAAPGAVYGGFEPPLFTSRVCVFRHALRAEGGCAACAADRTLRLSQGRKEFVLRTVRISGACLNLLFRRR